MKIRLDIKKRLARKGKTCADVSRHLNKNYNVINRYLNAHCKMPPEIEKKIEEYLKNV